MRPPQGIRRVQKEDFAYHTDVNNAYPLIERLFDNQQVCQLTMVYLIEPIDSNIMVAVNNSFTEMTKVG